MPDDAIDAICYRTSKIFSSLCCRLFAASYYYLDRTSTTFDDDKFTPTKHLTPPPHHTQQQRRPAAAHTDTETPLRCTKKKGRARRRTAPTDLAHSWAPQAHPRRRAWARGTVQRHVDAGFSPSTRC